MKENTNSRKVFIPCRFAYLNCFEPKSINGDEAKYSVCALIDKRNWKTINAINTCIEAAIKEFISKRKGQVPTDLKTPLRDGDMEFPEDEVFKNHVFLNAHTTIAPQIVDFNVEPILDKSLVYSGCYGIISVTFYGYHVDGNYGIAAGLGNIQKVKDGEHLSGPMDAVDEFDVVDTEDFLGDM
ncbi:MAG: DUF2815 family protein [Terrisporobacter sp.]|uniref:DUF2815 family protein n=1 Tax=Terrisporobacter sp. TaxID=1965305 RepID=UPI002FC9CC90